MKITGRGMGWGMILGGGCLAVFLAARYSEAYTFWPPSGKRELQKKDRERRGEGSKFLWQGEGPLFPEEGGRADPATAATDVVSYEGKIQALEEENKRLREALEHGRGVRRYTVQRGDSLWKIARRVYGDPYRWNTLYSLNRTLIKNPNRIYPFQVLEVGE